MTISPSGCSGLLLGAERKSTHSAVIGSLHPAQDTLQGNLCPRKSNNSSDGKTSWNSISQDKRAHKLGFLGQFQFPTITSVIRSDIRKGKRTTFAERPICARHSRFVRITSLKPARVYRVGADVPILRIKKRRQRGKLFAPDDKGYCQDSDSGFSWLQHLYVLSPIKIHAEFLF